MAAYLVRPLAFTAPATASETATAPATNLVHDHPGRVWRSISATSITIDAQGDGVSPMDTVALVGSDLLATDTVTVRMATTRAGLDSAGVTVSMPAFSGFKDATTSTKTVLRFSSQTFNWLRVTITRAAAAPVTASRLVIGQAVTFDGLDYGCDQSFVDQSLAIDGQSYTAYEEYPILTAWKFNVSNISNAAWRQSWSPLLKTAGKSRGVLFVPDDLSMVQGDIIFGRITTQASGKAEGWNYWTAAVEITGLAP